MNDTIYIMATGPSINNITEEEWEFLSKQHTIGFSGFPYSGKRTQFYYSHEKYFIDKEMIDIMAYNKYLDTTLLFYIGPSIVYAYNLGFKNIIKTQKGNANFLPGKPWFTDEEAPPVKFKNIRAKTFRQPLFRVRGQLSAVINSSLILGANEIRLVGVDLTCQKNFFSLEYQGDANPKWINNYFTKEIYCRLNEISKSITKSEGTKTLSPEFWKVYDPKINHSTNISFPREEYNGKSIRGIGDVLQWMDRELREEGLNGIYTTNKDSLLFKENVLQYKGIMDP
jgi:hypothetical protein